METFYFQHPIIYSISLTIFGAFLGALASYLIAIWQMRKQDQERNIKILHDAQGPIDIGSGLTSLFPDVQLYYKKEKIGYKIQYITGTIKNTDKKRTVTTLKLPFELILPNNCEVLESKILKAPKKEIKAEIKGNMVEISTSETFLPQEQIIYCILYKSPDKVDAEITLISRIADIDIIKTYKKAEELNDDIFDSLISKEITFKLLTVFVLMSDLFMILTEQYDFDRKFAVSIFIIAIISYFEYLSINKKK